MNGERSGSGGTWMLAIGIAGVAFAAAALRPSERTTLPGPGLPEVLTTWPAFQPEGGQVDLQAPRGGTLLLARHATDRLRAVGSDRARIVLEPDRRGAARLLVTPSATRFRRPRNGLPVATVLRAAERDDNGRRGPERLFTFVHTDHAALPVISLHVPVKGFFGADSGLYVPGLAELDPPAAVMERYLEDPRWWKHPGNYHCRGKTWERQGLLQVIAPTGDDLLHGSVRIRINGQMTRGFPQHALRLLFNEPLPVALFPGGVGRGARALVLRAAGNDQVKAMMRDAVLQDACAGLSFDVSRSLTCVVYLNGAYWGVHHLRQRLDERELALRHGLKRKQVALLELRMRKPIGDPVEVRRFKDLVAGAEHWDGHAPQWRQRVEAELDVEGFLTYMAAMSVLGNRDWPGDNVKFWRYTGKPGVGKPRDGRWYCTMGDVDLGFGANAPPSEPLLRQVQRIRSPVSALLLALLRAPDLNARFVAIISELLDGPLSSASLAAQVEARIALMAPEMERHTARWRKPADAAAWRRHADAMSRFAREREAHVREQLARGAIPPPSPS